MAPGFSVANLTWSHMEIQPENESEHAHNSGSALHLLEWKKHVHKDPYLSYVPILGF